ncbi:3'(2'),5'-bisphosphate nucleotidase CysQ [Arenibaculum pallidiluteum]|uniref:3'(2'),5'-bisphosphate nucleotidase CysQ n=1 Tax=Arenibaculum pallidiluteum TaxID=2812559 RepID=UPI001A957E1E|nr:3'(2'),5'-bisphosphate nucleotidase CysQ [Arenibaculum pallidiluteum]
MDPVLRDLLDRVVAIAHQAGSAILAVADTAAARCKDDGSPVTEADEAAEAVILPALAAAAPGIAIVSEEQAAATGIPAVPAGRFWLVDPLDGTKEFIRRSGEYTVNIALIEDGRPILGVVHAPALGLTYAGCAGSAMVLRQGEPARAIRARTPGAEGLVVVRSREHGDPDATARFLGGRRIAAERAIGSSLKLCLVAAGEADLYPRFGRTMEWDTAAGDAVVRAAGGRVEDLEGRPLAYGKPGFDNPSFVVSGLAVGEATTLPVG